MTVMTSTPATQQPPGTFTREHLGTVVSLSTFYAALVSGLYLWGYWSTFGVNILEYMSFSDVIRSTAIPILSSAVFVFTGMLGANAISRQLPPGGGRHTRIGRFLNKYVHALTAGVILWVVFVLVWGPPMLKWQMVAPYLAFAFAQLSGHWQFFASLLPDSRVRWLVLYVLAVLPTSAFSWGGIRGLEVHDGTRFDYVMSTVDEVPVPVNAEPLHRLRFLGHAGDFEFFFSPDASDVVISKAASGKSLVLRHYPPPK